MPIENEPKQNDPSLSATSAKALEQNAREIGEVKRQIEEAKQKHAEEQKCIEDAIRLRTEAAMDEKQAALAAENGLKAGDSTKANDKNKKMLGRLSKTAATARVNQEALRAETLAEKKTVKLKRQGPQYKMDIEVKGVKELDKSKQVDFNKEDIDPIVEKHDGKQKLPPPVEREPYSTPSPFAERQPTRDTDADLAQLSAEYAKKGLGEISAELLKLPEFQKLSNGQKMLVLQGANDKLLEYVSENASKAFSGRLETVDKTYAGEKSLVFKVQKWGEKVSIAARKNFLTARDQKKILKKTLGADAGIFVSEVAPELIAVFGNSGLRAELGPDGKTVVTDFAGLENPSPLARQMAEEYNVAASALARVPHEWRLEGATPKQKKTYENARLALVAAQDRLSPELIEHARRTAPGENPEIFAAAQLQKSEALADTMSWLSAHPDAARRLTQIDSRSAMREGLKDITAERIAIGVGSGALKGLSLFAGPVVGYFVGKYRGKERAKKSLSEQDKLARRGQRYTGDTAIRMGSAERQIGYLTKYKNQLLEASSDVERMKFAAELKTRVDFIELKLAAGHVNFGAMNGRFMRQYELGKILNEAKVAMSVHSNEKELGNIFLHDDETAVSLKDAWARKLIFKTGAGKKESIELARKQEIERQGRWGAFYGTLSGIGGAGFRYLHDHVGLLDVKLGVPRIHAQHPPTVPHEAFSFKGSSDGIRTQGSPAIDKLAHAQFAQRPSELMPSSAAQGNLVEAPMSTDDAAASVAFSSKGAEQTLLDFRHTAEFKNLSPEQQAFFKGNVAKIAEQLKAVRTSESGTESLTVGAGSKFGVTPDGKILVTDSLHGGKTTVLGHFENGAFKADATESDLQYVHAAKPEASSASPVRHEDIASKAGRVPRHTAEDLGLKHASPEETVVANPKDQVNLTPEQLRELAAHNEALKEIDSDYVSYNDMNQYSPAEELTPGQLDRVDRVADRMARHQINRFFTYMDRSGNMVHGQNSPVWRSMSFTPMRSVLSQDINTFQPPGIRPFLRHMRAIADKYPQLDRGLPLKRFIRDAYKFKAEDRVLGDHYAEL